MRNRGQSFLEFVFLTAVIVAGLIAMQIYIKRGVQGGLRNSSKQISQASYTPGQTATSNTDTLSASIEYSGIVPQTSVKYPRQSISVEDTYTASSEQAQIGSLKKDIKSDAVTIRQGSETTDNDYVQ